jgi:hypothetical protein
MFVADLLVRPAAFIRFGCLDVARRWRSVRRAAALLVKAAAAAASGELRPSCARLDRVLRWRKAPSMLLPQVSWSSSSICRPPSRFLDCWPWRR